MNQRIADLFAYVNGKLLWAQSRGRVQAGDAAGVIAKNGRRYVQVDGKKLLVHRIIWFMHYGDCPEFLDHIDGNPLNNKIANLRAATKQQNSRNRMIRSNNSTGFKGVYPKAGRFAASICVNGQNRYLGTFDTPEIAQLAYVAAAQQHFKEFARV